MVRVHLIPITAQLMPLTKETLEAELSYRAGVPITLRHYVGNGFGNLVFTDAPHGVAEHQDMLEHLRLNPHTSLQGWRVFADGYDTGRGFGGFRELSERLHKLWDMGTYDKWLDSLTQAIIRFMPKEACDG